MMEYIIPTLIVIVIAIVVFALLASIVRIVPQSRAYVVTWLGTFRTVWGAGVHFKVPIVERIAKNVSLKEGPPKPKVMVRPNFRVSSFFFTFLYIFFSCLFCPFS